MTRPNPEPAISQADRLLASDFADVLGRFEEAHETVSARLEENRALCDRKVAELGVGGAEEARAALRGKVLDLEAALARRDAWGSLDTKDGLKKTVRYLYALCPAEEKRGPFLKERVAARILHKMPPNRLLTQVARDKVRQLSPVSVLALTRFTEPREWQDAYLATLATLTAKDFEERDIRCLVVDREDFGGVLKLAGDKQKPWRISHNKEAGILVCFPLDERHDMPAPLTQYVAVFMHYFFEIASAAAFFRSVIRTEPNALGKRVRDVIRSHEHKFDFFHPNAYSEHLFWERALAQFARVFPDIPELQYFADTIDCGGYLGPQEEPISLNLIDQLWDINLGHRAETQRYFGEKQVSFLYHFREGLWYDLFRRLLGLSKEKKRAAVIEHLDLGDQRYTEHMLKQRES